MEIIDLLNIKAKGEKMPRKIIFNEITYLYNSLCEDYEDSFSGDLLFEDRYDANKILNREVTITEEEKEIEKIKIDEQDRIQARSTGNFVYKVNQPTKNIIYKINELIDVINEMRNNDE